MIPKYRGRSISEENEGQWVYGNLIVDGNYAYIVNGVIESNDQYITIAEWCPVALETIGASTDLFDFYAKEIFDGDFIQDQNGITYLVCYVKERGRWEFVDVEDEFLHLSILFENIEEWRVIGNIYQHPHLLEAADGH